MASLEHRGGNKWRASFYNRGDRATKVIEAKSEAQAKRIANELEVKFKETGNLDGKTKADKNALLVADIAQEYMDIKTGGDDPIKEKTRQKYQDLFDNYILPYFRGCKANSITPYQVEKFKQFICTPEVRLNKYKKTPLAKSTIAEIFKLFAYMMNKAEVWQFIDKNPCKNVEIPKVAKKEIEYYNLEELVELLSLLDRDTQLELERAELMREQSNFQPFTIQKNIVTALKNQLVVNIAIKTGARRGEILGLRRSDINLTDKFIRFSRSVLYTQGKQTYLEEGLKTRNENTVFINDNLIEMIERYCIELDKVIELSDGVIEPNDLLFMSLRRTGKFKAGHILNPDNVSSQFKGYLKKKGLRQITFHKLRSSSLTYFANSGIDLVTVANIAGHGDVAVTKQYYVEGYDKTKIQAANKFNAIDDLVEQSRNVDK